MHYLNCLEYFSLKLPVLNVNLATRKYNIRLPIMKRLMKGDIMVAYYVPSGAVYSEYRSGPSTVPWGTLQVNGRVVDQSLPIETICFLSARYDVN